ncbi:MAG: hypothetical protein ABIQ70_07490 [Dokdonella sp.]
MKPAPTLGAARNGLCALVLVAIVAFVYWPGVHGFWGRDDFMQLAFARLIGSPWPLFTHDHFPVPGSVFRPLGFASMWLCATLLGAGYQANAIADLALHAVVSVALLFLLLRAATPRPIAFLSSLLFALHPAVIGTALWWSARFDLLSTLFVLLAMLAAFDYRERMRWRALACALLAALAAMLSKEIGLAVVVAMSLLWLHWAWVEPACRPRAIRALALTCLFAAIYLSWRWCVLGTPSSGIAGATPAHQLIAKGLLDWLRQAPGYWSFWIRLRAPQRSALVLGIVFLAASIVAACASRQARTVLKTQADLAICGFSLLLLPALLQAPVAALNAAPLNADVSFIESAMQSRLYYLGLVGVAIALAAFTTAAWHVAAKKMRIVVVAGFALCAIAFASASHRNAHAFAKRSLEISEVARAAVSAVNTLDLPASHCHVVFLDIDPAPEWSVYVSMDSIVKALSPDLARVRQCYFHSNYVTYFHMIGGPVDLAGVAPYRPSEDSSGVLPWRRIGDLTIGYLELPETAGANALASMTFLRYRDGRFANVSGDVVAGRLAVHPR